MIAITGFRNAAAALAALRPIPGMRTA